MKGYDFMLHLPNKNHPQKKYGSLRLYGKFLLLLLLTLWFLFLTFISQTQASRFAETGTGYGGNQINTSQSSYTLTPSQLSTDTQQTQEVDQTTTTQSFQFPSIQLPDPGEWLWDGIGGFFQRFYQAAIDFFQHQIIDWASSFGFLYITPAILSYKNPMVLAGVDWSLTALNGLVAILLVVAGYQAIIYRYLDLQETSIMGSVIRIAFGAILANIGPAFFIPQLIELCNFINMSFLGHMLQSAGGDVTLPLGGINWVSQPLTWAVFVLIHFVVSILFIFVELVRIALLDICIILSPWWFVLLANEYTKPWGQLGAVTFASALLVQPLQVVIVGLGSALIANFGQLNYNDPSICNTMEAVAKQACLNNIGHASVSASNTPIALFIGIATMYIAVKIPGMLFSEAVRVSVGSVNRDIGNAAKTALNAVMGTVMFTKQLVK